MKEENLVGQKFGKLTAVEQMKLPSGKGYRTYYKCICECGNERIALGYQLKNGEITECSECVKQHNTNRIDRVGEKYNHLTINEMLYNYEGKQKTYVRCTCDCGNERIAYVQYLISGKTYACNECSEKTRVEKKRKDYTGERFGRLIILEMLYNYGEQNKTYAKCQCDCGNIKNINMRAIKSGDIKSCGCLEIESRFEREHYIDITGNKYGYLTVIEKTDKYSSNGSVIWKCQCDCGNITYVASSNLKSGHTSSCGCRKTSQWEELIRDYLLEHGIEFDSEHRFRDCTNIQGTDMLPFDFYIESMNLAIEYDGQQHFSPVECWGGEEKLQITQRNDKIKNEYCKNNNIELIRIPYTMKKDEIYKLLDDIFVRNE